MSEQTPRKWVKAEQAGKLNGAGARGWRERELPEGERVAGLRTFTLTGLLRGVLGLLLLQFGAWPLLGGLVGLSLLLAVSYGLTATSSGNFSATSAVAMLVTVASGALAAGGVIILVHRVIELAPGEFDARDRRTST